MMALPLQLEQWMSKSVVMLWRYAHLPSIVSDKSLRLLSKSS